MGKVRLKRKIASQVSREAEPKEGDSRVRSDERKKGAQGWRSAGQQVRVGELNWRIKSVRGAVMEKRRKPSPAM